MDLSPNAQEGRPRGLYGNNFVYTHPEAIKKAIHKMDPPTITNLIAMEAPKGYRGDYTMNQILDIFTTAYTSFSAARIESYLANGSITPKVIIHTGNWGTGFFEICVFN